MTMKLSDAMFTGIPQTDLLRFNFIERRGPRSQRIRACPLGAAYIVADPAVKADILDTSPEDLSEADWMEAVQDFFPQLKNQVEYRLPDDRASHQYTLMNLIMVLNDRYKIRRDTIARIVATLGY